MRSPVIVVFFFFSNHHDLTRLCLRIRPSRRRSLTCSNSSATAAWKLLDPEIIDDYPRQRYDVHSSRFTTPPLRLVSHVTTTAITRMSRIQYFILVRVIMLSFVHCYPAISVCIIIAQNIDCTLCHQKSIHNIAAAVPIHENFSSIFMPLRSLRYSHSGTQARKERSTIRALRLLKPKDEYGMNGRSVE